MGVSHYFRNLIKKYPDIIRPLKDAHSPVDTLYIDANSMIHPTAYTVLKKIKGMSSVPSAEDIETSIATSFCEYLRAVCVEVDPKDLMYVAIDGPAPRAKIHQQRQRRYKSSKVRQLSDQWYRDLGLESQVSVFDSNAITPGTSFMTTVTGVIKSYFKENPVKCKVILSSSNVVGEGEHKIMAHIRDNVDKKKPKSIYVYGLDADLIFLSLSLHMPNVTLLRERVYFGEAPVTDDDETVFDLLSIDDLAAAFEQDSKNRTRCSFDMKRVIDDYVFICFLLGNDFLPHVPALTIHTGGLETVQRSYYGILRNSDKHLVFTDGTVNRTFLKALLTSLSSEEEKLLAEQAHRKANFRYNVQFQPDPEKSATENQHARKMFDFDLAHKAKFDTVGLGRKGWKWRYYSKYCGLTPSERPQEYDRYRRQMVREFLRGMMWTLTYYKGSLLDYRWYYPYDIAPTLSDLVEFFDEFEAASVFSKTKPYKPIEQLLMVLPPDSAELLPKSYRPLVTDTESVLAHVFPIDFSVQSMDKIHYSETVPLLPHVDEAEFASAMKNLRLTTAEKERNAVQKQDAIL